MGSGSGNKREILNTRERVVSTDWNRMQQFIAAGGAEALRWMMSAQSTEGGASSVGSSTTSPLTAIVVNGLWARPEIGTVNLFVEPGTVGMVNPDAVPSADDSPFKVITDAGVQVAGALTLTAGAVGTRIDVIECSRVVEVLESDNRDIFNPATGLFSPVLVPKVERDRLSYRIRVGVAGAGFPGTVSGWLPLAVASVPSTATTWNDVTLFDVRPLMQDLVRSPAQVLQTFPHRPHAWATAVEETALGRKLRGFAEAERRQWRVGGEFGSVLSGLIGGALDLAGTDVVEPGFAVTNNRPWYVYAVFPHALPRWARYSPSSSGQRVPLPFKGIPVFTQKAPTNGQHTNLSVAVTLPSTFGFTATTTDGTPLVTGGFDNAGNWMNTVVESGWHRFAKGGAGVAAQAGLKLAPSAGAGTATATYDLVDNTTHPVGAVCLLVKFITRITGSAPNFDQGGIQWQLQVLDSLGASMVEETRRATATSGSTGVVDHQQYFEVPLHTIGAMPGDTPITRQIKFANAIGDAVMYSNQEAHVVGWKFS